MKLLYFKMKSNITVVKKECFHTVLTMDNSSVGTVFKQINLLCQFLQFSNLMLKIKYKCIFTPYL